MINVSDNFKQAMKKPVKTITASLVLDDNTIITGQDKLIKITIDSSGHLFGTATSVVNVELFGTDYNLVDHTFSVIAKTLVDIENDTWEEANLGLFYVEESTADFEKKITKIKGYDLMGKLAKTPYNSGTIQFPCTVKELINQLAERFEFTVDTNLDNLPNITYQIPEDLYAKISNCTYRDILGEIAGATATIAVFNGKALSFRDSKKKSDEDEIWTYDNLKTLKYKPKYGPVNSLVLARTPQEDNIATSDNDSITANGLTEVKLANNEILDDDRRSLIDPIFSSIKGLSYHPFEAETTGLGWHKPGDLVSAQAGGGLMNGKTIGWLEQKTITGKNAIDYSAKNIGAWQCTAESYGNGVKITAKTFSGVAYVAKVIPNSASFLGKTITISAKISGSVTQCAIYALRGTATYERLATLPANGGTYKIPDNFPADRDGFGVLFYVSQNSISTVTNVQVELSSTATGYEPYTGGYNNLFDEFSNLPIQKNGISLTNQNGVLKLSGKPDADWVPLIFRDLNGLADKTTYTVVAYNQNTTQLFSEIMLYKKDGSGIDKITAKGQKIFTFTTDSTKYNRYAMKLGLGPVSEFSEPVAIYNNYSLFQGNYNEDNLPEYSPYNTGLSSPRPQLPQVVKELSDSNIKVVSRNLIKVKDLTSTQTQANTTVNPDNSITVRDENRNNWGMNITDDEACPRIEKGTKVTMSLNRPLPYELILSCWTNTDGDSFQFPLAIIDAGSTSVTNIAQHTALSGHLLVSLSEIGKQINETFKVQLEYGDTATPFVPYESSEFTIPSGFNIYKLTDTIYDEVKLENGVAKMIKRVGKLELSGDEADLFLYKNTVSGTIGFSYDTKSYIFKQSKLIPDVICSHFNSINEGDTWHGVLNSSGISIFAGRENFPLRTKKIVFWFSLTDATNLKITDLTSFKNWLKAEKAKGRPVTVYYEMKTPQTIELGRTNLNQVYITDTHLELGNGFKETIKGIAPTATQTDYARAGGITKTIYNTEIKVDKQKQEIESIVSKQTQVDQQIAEEFSKITQNIKNVVTTIQTTGGGNLIKNSVGYAKNQDGTLVEWTKNNVGEVKSYTSPESRSYGAISGNAIELKKSASITQRLNVASSGKIPYTLSFRCKKSAIGTATVKLSNTIDSFVITIPEGKEIVWQNYDLTKLDPSMNYLDITVSTSNNCEQFLITDLMVNMGDQSIPWVQASGEILNTQVAVNDQGMMVSSSVYSGDYVQITPLGMSGHSNVTGTDEEVFKLNRDVTETSKLSARKEISMEPIKIIPVKDGDMAGWNFVG
jgi:hypothetical protein